MTHPETATINVDQYVPHPPRKVWRALTDPELMARWWAKGNIGATAGHRFELDMEQWGIVSCTILESRPDEFLSYSFGESWTISWRLVPEGDGTRIFLEHAGLDLSNPRDRFAFDNMGQGWRTTVLPRLASLLDELPVASR